MKVVFDGLRETTHVQFLHGNRIFVSAGEKRELPEAEARDVIQRGLARALSGTMLSLRVRAASDSAVKKVASTPLCVVIPTAGGRAGDLDRTLAAVCFEPPSPLSVCVVLDGAKDAETEQVVSWWKIRLAGLVGIEPDSIHHDEKCGPNMARRTGIYQAPKNAIIIEVDDHDAPEPGAVRRIAEPFDDPNVQAVYADHFVVDAKGRLARRVKLEDYQDVAFRTFCPARGIRAYRRSLYDAVGGYRKAEFPAGDHWLWLRFAAHLEGRKGAILHIPEALSRFKLCEGAISVQYATQQRQSSERAVMASMSGTILPRRKRVSRGGEPALPDYSDVSVVKSGASWRSILGTHIVVPCYRSERYIAPLLASMGPEREAVTLVIDGEKRYEQPCSQVVLSKNTGFAHACNQGAEEVGALQSKYICFLNADVTVKPGWLETMVNEIESAPDIAAVGNRQVDGKGLIHSCGSSWSWGSRNFEHVLRGKKPGNQPEWMQARDVDMITASCLLVKRDVFEAVGGFDQRFRIGYWEDSDLCMKIRQAGYRIRFTPESEIVHFTGHSGGVHHAHYQANSDLCRNRWAKTGLVDKFARQRGERVHSGQVVACYIVLNEEEYIQASLESIYGFVDKIIIVEGGNDYAVAAGLCGADKRSTDRTIEQIENFPDLEHKIELIQGRFSDKTEQRNEYAKRLADGDWMLLMDGDEVFFDSGLWRLSALMHEMDVIKPSHFVFWNDFKTIGTGLWDLYPQMKVVHWRKGYRYGDHNYVQGGAQQGHKTEVNERLYAHYAWVKPIDKLRMKAAYYERQPGSAGRMRPDYIDTVFLPFRERPLHIVQTFGTHPFGRGGAAMFQGEHPAPMRRRLAVGEFDWE